MDSARKLLINLLANTHIHKQMPVVGCFWCKQVCFEELYQSDVAGLLAGRFTGPDVLAARQRQTGRRTPGSLCTPPVVSSSVVTDCSCSCFIWCFVTWLNRALTYQHLYNYIKIIAKKIVYWFFLNSLKIKNVETNVFFVIDCYFTKINIKTGMELLLLNGIQSLQPESSLSWKRGRLLQQHVNTSGMIHSTIPSGCDCHVSEVIDGFLY